MPAGLYLQFQKKNQECQKEFSDFGKTFLHKRVKPLIKGSQTSSTLGLSVEKISQFGQRKDWKTVFQSLTKYV